MNRRTLLSNLGKAAAASLSPAWLGALAVPSSLDRHGRTQAQLTNGAGSLEFVKGTSGLGLELSTGQGHEQRRVASVQNPVRVFYDRRGNGSEKDVEFSSVLPVGDGLVTSAELTDARQNRWFVRLQVSK